MFFVGFYAIVKIAAVVSTTTAVVDMKTAVLKVLYSIFLYHEEKQTLTCSFCPLI